jgi:hypothetical protein
MAQNYNDEIYSQATVVDTTMTRVENNFAAQKSSFSGTSNPADQVPGMLHMRTGGTGDGLRVRNVDDDAWHKVLTGDANQKMWVYRNDTCEGWTIDATVTDRVLALKGGSDAYNVDGGVTAGETWANFSGHTHAMGDHVHKWYDYRGTGTTGQTYNSAGTATNITQEVKTTAATTHLVAETTLSASAILGMDTYTNPAGSSANTGGSNTSDMRPAAAVGTLQYPDLS